MFRLKITPLSPSKHSLLGVAFKFTLKKTFSHILFLFTTPTCFYLFILPKLSSSGRQ